MNDTVIGLLCIAGLIVFIAMIGIMVWLGDISMETVEYRYRLAGKIIFLVLSCAGMIGSLVGFFTADHWWEMLIYFYTGIYFASSSGFIESMMSVTAR